MTTRNKLKQDEKDSRYGRAGYGAETGSVPHSVSYPMLTAVKAAGRVKQITDKQSNEQFRRSVGILCLEIGSAQGILMHDNKERIGPTSTPQVGFESAIQDSPALNHATKTV
jgi:hypothetical protein